MNSDIIKGQWNQLAGRAKLTWSAITDDDLLRIEGDMQRLSGLLQERYGMARAEAETQIRRFLQDIDAVTRFGTDRRALERRAGQTPGAAATARPR